MMKIQQITETAVSKTNRSRNEIGYKNWNEIQRAVRHSSSNTSDSRHSARLTIDGREVVISKQSAEQLFRWLKKNFKTKHERELYDFLAHQRLLGVLDDKPVISELAPSEPRGEDDILKTLAAQWIHGDIASGDLSSDIQSQEQVERRLEKGIVCQDGVKRKLYIDYNQDYDGVVIYGDDNWSIEYKQGDLTESTQDMTEGTGQQPGQFEIINLRTMQRAYHPFEANDIIDAQIKADDWLEAIGKTGRGLMVRPVKEQDVTEGMGEYSDEEIERYGPELIQRQRNLDLLASVFGYQNIHRVARALRAGNLKRRLQHDEGTPEERARYSRAVRILDSMTDESGNIMPHTESAVYRRK